MEINKIIIDNMFKYEEVSRFYYSEVFEPRISVLMDLLNVTKYPAPNCQNEECKKNEADFIKQLLVPNYIDTKMNLKHPVYNFLHPLFHQQFRNYPLSREHQVPYAFY